MSSHFGPRLRSFFGLLLGVLLVHGSLQAQLDPRLQSSKTDFLDLFQQSSSLTKMKPELLTLLDFTGSMTAFMFSPGYPNIDVNDNQGSDRGITFTLTGPGNNTTTYKDKYGTTLPIGRYEVTANMTCGQTLTKGVLVRPDGSVLEYRNNGDQLINTNYNATDSFEPAGGVATLAGETAATKASDVRNWVRCASHVRFTAGGKTFDLPIGWTALASSTVVRNTAAGEYRQQYMTYPLRFTLLDPASNKELEIDRSYRVNASRVFGGSATSLTISSAVAGHRPAHINWIWNTSTTIPQATSAAGYAFANGIPPYTRANAIKTTFAIVWAKYWDKVLWSYRFINDQAGSSGVLESVSRLGNDSRNDMSASNYLSSAIVGGTQRAWVCMNKDSYVGLQRLASYIPSGGTPLNYAFVNALAQYNDPNSIFNDVEIGADAPIECRKSFLLLFTDGQPNGESGNPASNVSPYYNDTSLSGSATLGNSTIATTLTPTPTCLEPGVVISGQSSQWFNIITLAALAAHGADATVRNTSGTVTTVPFPSGSSFPITGYPGATTWPTAAASTVRAFAPFAIAKRGSTQFTKPHLITTMTVGISLAQANWVGSTPGAILSTDPKFRLLGAAAVGDPDTQTWNLQTVLPFALVDDKYPEKGKAPGTCNYFDATDPAKLTSSLDSAFLMATLASNVNSTTNPNVPFVGVSFGQQIYLGQFKPPLTGGPIWPGDLLMFATKSTGGQTQIIGSDGNVAPVLNASTAQWSASASMASNRLWSGRKLYTRLTGTSTTPEPGFVRFSDIDTLPAPDNGAFTKIKSAVGSPLLTDAQRKLLIQFASGGDINGIMDAQGRPTVNRSSIMGDIINSAPSVLEYNWTDVQSFLTPTLAAVGGNRFRLILVGTNQGWLHAFGEVTKITTVKDSTGTSQQVTQGAVDELWSFMPTDFLAHLNDLTTATNPHRFMVDGSPTIYHLDLPNSAGGPGNGVQDVATERAMVLFGLRKGGRSYYAIDIHDPFNPALKWSLVPDEAAVFPTSRIASGGPLLTTVQPLLNKMGFSTCTPALGRIMFGRQFDSTGLPISGTGRIRDAIFLGGGYSVPEVETNFAGTKLGRSVMALDVYTGEVLAAADLGTNAGPVSAGLVPFEFILNSGMAQRAYFLDYFGGLWAWGSGKTATSAPYTDHRIDSSDLDLWTVDGAAGSAPSLRKVAQDTSLNPISQSVKPYSLYTTLPAPFRVGNFPGVSKVAGGSSPAAVGVAMISGDRNNPLDSSLGYVTVPANFRLSVVFDRQDSKAWGLDTAGIQDTDLKDFTSQNNPASSDIQPGSSSYYLAPLGGSQPKFGYLVNLPGASGGFIPKGISEPMVVGGSLFYSYFNPNSADPCSGGSGATPSNLICDVISPIINDSRTNVACKSGTKFTWAGVASGYMALGTRGVMQAGVISTGITPPPGTDGSATTLQLQTLPGRQQERYPKVRTWRTIH